MMNLKEIVLKKYQKKPSDGFTLIELIIVVSVIAILAGITLVAYPKYQENARDTKRKSDLHAIADAYKAAKADNQNLASDAFPLIPNFSSADNFTTKDPTLAGNENVSSKPGGELGRLGYLKETLQDPKWTTDPPVFSENMISYSGYILIPCSSASKGFYMVARLENPSNQPNKYLQELKEQVGALDGENPSPDSASCFYYEAGYNAKDNRINCDTGGWIDCAFEVGLKKAIFWTFPKLLLDESNGYNYAVYVK